MSQELALLFVPITADLRAVSRLFGKTVGEHQKRTKQHIIKKLHLLVEHYMTFVNYTQKVYKTKKAI